MMLKTLSQSSVITLFSLGLLACGGGSSSSNSSSSTGTIDVNITDAAVDGAEKIYVQFTGVTFKPGEGDAESHALTGDSQTCLGLLDEVDPSPTPEGEATVRCIELKELQGTNSASLLDDVTLTAGEYSWMRLDVDAERGVMDSLVVLDDGSRESLYIPSGSQSGLKLNTAYTILAGGTHNFVIDFDLRKSVNNPQGFADYRLKPSLRLVDLSSSGNLVGTVDVSQLTAQGCTGDTSTGAGFAVYVYRGADATLGEEGSENAPLTSASVSSNEDGSVWSYTVGYLPPEEYTAAFTCQAVGDTTEDPNNGSVFVESEDNPVTVVADQDSEANFGPAES